MDLPVLGPGDVHDVQDFACKNGMDFIAASFVQSADDVRCVYIGSSGVLVTNPCWGWRVAPHPTQSTLPAFDQRPTKFHRTPP